MPGVRLKDGRIGAYRVGGCHVIYSLGRVCELVGGVVLYLKGCHWELEGQKRPLHKWQGWSLERE